jgi:diguanylate cyclase (GGDEF)-like protein
MTIERVLKFAPPSIPLLKWLIDPGTGIPWHIAEIMLVEHFASAGTVVAAIVNSLMVSSLALALHGGRIFYVLLAADLLTSVIRLGVIRRVARCRVSGTTTPTDSYLIAAIAWAAVQGAIGFAAMRSNISSLQTISAITAIMITGAVTYRNYPSPRYAMLLFSLIYLPLLGGVIVARDHWLLALFVTTPLYYFASILVMGRLQRLSIDSLKARHDSQFQASHDSLTGLLNRLGLMQAMQDPAMAQAHRLTLFYFDLDGFKQINDTRGHPVGDRLLQLVGQRLAAGIRAGDVAARIGGDEFVVMAPELRPEAAADFAGRLTRQIETPYELEDVGRLRIGVSVGYACAPEDSATLDELYRMADAALYAVKGSAKGTQQRFNGGKLAATAAGAAK